MKKYSPTSIVFLLMTFLFSINSYSQGPGSLFVDAGADVEIPCGTGGCTNITADFLETFETDVYNVVSAPYSPDGTGNPPFPFNGLANSVNTNIDDAWDSPHPLPYDFCFFADIETQFQVGSNGVIRFDVDAGDTSNGWAFSESLPNNSNPTLGEANVFTPVHDIDPSVSTTNEIGWEITGSYPNRVLIVSFFAVPYFSCNSLRATHMAVFYEFSNVIEFYVKDKPVCNAWNSGNAALGIQNDAGTTAYVPPGRNTSQWTAADEAWSINPSGAPTYVFEWLNASGTVIGTSPTINVCPSGGSEVFTARVTYTNCNGDTVILTDDVLVTENASFTFDLGPDVSTCDDTTNILLDTAQDPGFTYQWFLDGTAIAGETNPTYLVVAPNSGTYSVDVIDPADPACTVIDTIIITYLPQPIIASPPQNLFSCDDGSGNPIIFDLTENDDDVLGGQDPLIFNITYHNSLADADTGANPIGAPGAYAITGSNETICVRIEDLSGTCFATACFDIDTLIVTAGAVSPNPLGLCDADASGDEEVDLPDLYDAQVLNGLNSTEYEITYHISQTDADADVNALPIPYAVVAPSEIIYIRLENIANPICADTSQNVEIIIETLPIPFIPPPLIVCDDDNDGFTEFNLTDANDSITGGDPDLTVTYHDTQENADEGILPLPDPYLNETPYNDFVFARVESLASDCYAVVILNLEVRNSPLIIDPEPLRLCDYNNPGDGFEEFNLTEVEEEVLNGLDPAFWDFYYYENQADAIIAGDLALTIPDFSLALANPGAYINITPNQQDVYILVVGNLSNIDPHNGGNGCYNIATLPLYVDPLPTAFEPTDRYELCDDEVENVSTGTDQTSAFDLTSYDDLITQGDTTLFVTWYETPADEIADNPIVDPTAYRNTVLNEQTVVARVTNVFTCHITVLLTLRVNPNPTPFPPSPLEVCDDDNDGFAEFILTDANDEIIGGEPDVTIAYYENEILAREGDIANILTIPYTNDDPFIDTVWARIDNGTTGCFSLIELTLIVNQLPDMPTVEFDDLVACDEDGTGMAIFDLTENIPFIIGSQDASDFLPITFYTSLADADVPTNPILNPTAFPSTGQTIWVRIENATTACLRILSFDLIVEALPLIGAGPFSHHLCDDMLNGSTGTDLTSTFNLAENNDLITLSNITLSVFYYETVADQDAGNFIDPDTAYQNLTTPQTLQVSVFSVEGCEVRTLLTLQVDNNPSPVSPLPLQGCDDDDDGITQFILTDKDDEIIGGEANVAISYYETQEQAINGDPLDALASPYTNTVPFSQIIWVRDEYTFGLNCYTVISLKLQVNPLPDDSVDVSDEIDCQVPFVGTNSIILDSKNPEILNGQDPLIFDVLYFETQADALAMTNPIASTIPYFYDTTGITIYVDILNTETGCYVATQSFLLIVQEGVIAITPSLPYAICDYENDNDGTATFDLLDFSANINGIDIREEILDGQDPTIFTLHFYETLEAAELGDFLNDDISPSYTNIINPQVIYARVTNTLNTVDYADKCHEIVEVILKVEELPIINIDEEYRLCVDANFNPIAEEEGEMSPPVIDTGLDPTVYSFVWDLGGTVLLGELGASITALQGGTYTVTVTEIATGCENSESATVTVSSPPLVYSAEVVSGAFAINEVIHTDTSGVETTFTGTHVIHVTATGEGEYIYQLDEGVFQEGDVFVDVQPGVHIVTIKDKFGCGSVEITLSVVDYPRFITPNEDGYHDTWNIIGIAGLDPTAKIYIFDRYGKLLKQISPLGPGWDGTYNGNTLPSSDYWFRVEYLEDNTRKEIKGHFTLKR